ncbi:aldo/keto reductase [Nocardioides humi]|uniref:aldo/keto reductase n=1 Tax=Nocardioides humi TaxID=449461 RepID=UPI0015E8487B|nr:aldo/keto reductase [Nocardioides humi]
MGDREILRVGLGGARWSITDPEDDGPAERLLELAIEAGVTYLDTARAYTTRDGEAHNERLLRRVLDRIGAWDDVLVGTKGGHYRADDSFPIDASPASLRRDCERSLGALGRDRIDLYYLHFPDPQVPFAESVGALAELRSEGLVGEVGLCNVTTAQFREALGIVPVAAVQNRMSPYAPVDTPLLALAAERGASFFAYSPLGGTTPPVGADELSPAALDAARERGVTTQTVLLAWLLGHGDHVAVVTGARRPTTLRASLRAVDLGLTVAEHDAIAADLAERW